MAYDFSNPPVPPELEAAIAALYKTRQPVKMASLLRVCSLGFRLAEDHPDQRHNIAKQLHILWEATQCLRFHVFHRHCRSSPRQH